ncbi:hypothetical protein PHBOTO_004515 [Pseudozyma hubeiensis]|nr:hypothetical protein PHBOTO_004515 [Pseudozyma hubeiensis]
MTTPATITSSFAELSPHVQPSSASALSALLEANHASHHCFFNTRGMHNHSAHQLIADLTISATPTQLQQHYDYQLKHYLSGFSYNDRSQYDPHHPSFNGKIVKIDETNWRDHLGNARFYWSYLHFFDEQVEKIGFRGVLEKYVLSADANEGKALMLVRFYGGVLHAWIHFGYGIELGMGELAGEGLAMASATAAGHAWLFDHGWLFGPAGPEGEKTGLMELIKEVQDDKRLSVDALGLKNEESSLPDAPFENDPAKGVIQSYVDRWSSLTDADQAMGELSLFSALLLGAVPKQPDSQAYKHDFFLMHLNNAHLFTPLYLDLLSSTDDAAKSALLKGLLAQFLYYYVCRGRPVFSKTNWQEQFAGKTVLDWQTMFREARENVDEHLPKAVRSLYVFESRYSGFQKQLLDSHLLDQGETPQKENEEWMQSASVWRYTASQLVRMHRGELQKSKYDDVRKRKEGESVGAHQEFWSFDPFF